MWTSGTIHAMKRTILRRYTPLRSKNSTKMGKLSNKQPKSRIKPIRGIKKRLWELCKQIIRTIYGNVCYTCGKSGLSGSGWQTGHFIPSAVCGANLRYDLRNLRPQCFRCNIDLSGNGAIFYRKMVQCEGQEYVDQLFHDKNTTIKADYSWFESKIKEYEQVLTDLRSMQTTI